jgi:hypothetical protein
MISRPPIQILLLSKTDEANLDELRKAVRELQDVCSGFAMTNEKILLQLSELQARYDNALREIAALQQKDRPVRGDQPQAATDSVAIRTRFPTKDLDPYVGQYVAFAPDGSAILAGAPDLPALEKALAAAGKNISDSVVDYIEAEDTVVGGAELL